MCTDRQRLSPADVRSRCVTRLSRLPILEYAVLDHARLVCFWPATNSLIAMRVWSRGLKRYPVGLFCCNPIDIMHLSQDPFKVGYGRRNTIGPVLFRPQGAENTTRFNQMDRYRGRQICKGRKSDFSRARERLSGAVETRRRNSTG